MPVERFKFKWECTCRIKSSADKVLRATVTRTFHSTTYLSVQRHGSLGFNRRHLDWLSAVTGATAVVSATQDWRVVFTLEVGSAARAAIREFVLRGTIFTGKQRAVGKAGDYFEVFIALVFARHFAALAELILLLFRPLRHEGWLCRQGWTFGRCWLGIFIVFSTFCTETV